MTKPYQQDCPIARTLDIVGDRWTILIVRDLFFGRTRFTQFLASSPGLPPKLLSDRLKKLDEHGLIERVIYSHHPLRAEYHLTDEGRSLAPVLEAMVHWGLEHCFHGEPETRDEVAQRIFERVPPLPGSSHHLRHPEI
jgi:DNA-binding HxlR family transcriptional regulator